MSQMTSPENGGEGCGDHSTAAVGGRAAALSPYGAQDMSGNALEWTLDFLNPEFYATGPATNPINREPSQRRVIRGGAWNNEPAFLRTTTRGSFPADFRTVYTSFRCAM
jgi:formylglycine-generating enzyme required for sulfatase activity